MTDLSCECVHVDPLGGPVAPGEYPDGTFGGGPSTPGGGSSPLITDVSPNPIPANDPNVVLVVRGSGFEDGATILFGLVGLGDQVTTFVSDTEVTCNLTMKNAGLYTVQVRNPFPGNVLSNQFSVQVGAPPPDVTSVSPVTFRQPEVAAMTIIGTGFTPTTTVEIGNKPQVVTFVSDTELTVAAYDTMIQSPQAQIAVDVMEGLRGDFDTRIEVKGELTTLASITPNTVSQLAGGSLAVVGTGINKYTMLLIGASSINLTDPTPTGGTVPIPPNSTWLAIGDALPSHLLNGYEASNDLPVTVTA